MVLRNRWLYVTSSILLAVALSTGSGCSKQFQKIHKKKAEKVLNEAVTKFKAETHAPAVVKRTRDQLGESENFFNARDFKQASAMAREAVRSAKEALATAKKMEATVQRDAADHEVQVMKINNGNTENPELYQKIIETQTKMHTRYNKEHWVATIEIARQIKEDVDRLLLRLRRQANDDLVAVKAEYQRLLDEGGKTHALIYVNRVSDLISEIQKNIDPPTKDYLTAIELSKQAMIDAQAGITESKRKRCEIAIESIQRKLIQAQRKKAEFFVPELWSASSDDFARLVENFWKKEYDFVLGAARQLEGQVDTLIYETRKASAQYQIDKLKDRIKDLRDKGVDVYLPGRLAPVEGKLQSAQDLFKPPDEKFEDVEVACKDAQLIADSIMNDFRAMAEKWINTGRKVTEVAADLYKNMQRIFDSVHPEYVKPQDQALENNKQAIRTELGRRLAQAQQDVAQAEIKFNSQDYRDTIETSKAVKDEATTIIATIYNVVAHNVITEIADEITRYDREGAQKYARAEMALTKKLLGEAIDLRNRKEYEASASKAAEARAELERTIEAIQEAAAKAIQAAEQQLKRANETKTSELQPDQYQQAQRLILQARTQREATQLADSIQTAANAEKLIRRASQQAAKIWAEQERANAAAALVDARKTGADIYAAQLLHDADEDAAQAGRVLEAADTLLGQQKFEEARNKYLEAKDLAVSAAEGANRAKFRLIDEAEAAIVEARSYEAWRNKLPDLTRAILALDDAKQAMTAGNFDQSHDLAKTAKAEAEKITAAAKKITFNKRLEVVDGLVSEATAAGGRYFTPHQLVGIARELDRLRTQYRSKTFDSSAKEVAKLEAQLQDLVDAMPDVVAKWLSIQKERLAEIEKSDIPPTFTPRISEAKKFLRFADLDYKRGKYRNSYSNLLVGRRIVDRLSDGRARFEYGKKVQKLLNDLETAMKDFDQFLSLKPRTLLGLTKGASGDRKFVAIAGRSTPTDFRERLEQLLVQLQAIQPPTSMTDFHQELAGMLVDARKAAIKYERLGILAEYDESQRRRLVEQAYGLIQKVRQRRGDLEQALTAETMLAQKM